MKRVVVYFISFLSLVACSEAVEVTDARIGAYEAATEKAIKAETSEELVAITYNLQKELMSLEHSLVSLEELRRNALSGNEESAVLLDRISSCSENFSRVLAEREMEFYINAE